MMIRDHPVFRSIDSVSRTAKIWRYFDLSKFRLLIENEALWFARSDLFKEEYEGSYPISEVKNRNKWRDDHQGFTLEDVEAFIVRLERNHKDFRRSAYVNCWQQNETESMSMWDRYANQKKGVAVCSTLQQLYDELPLFYREQIDSDVIYITKVEYIDHNDPTWVLPFSGNPLAPYPFKSVAFSDEHEIRAIFFDFNNQILNTARESFERQQIPYPEDTEIKEGYSIKINLRNFINSIVVAPKSTPEFKSEVLRLCSKSGLHDIVKSSMMDKCPSF